MEFRHLDAQASRFSDDLAAVAGCDVGGIDRLASAIAKDLAALPLVVRKALQAHKSADTCQRFDEIAQFQSFLDSDLGRTAAPSVVRANLSYQSYVCFVYLSEACFRIIARCAPEGSIAQRCARYLTERRVLVFRDAMTYRNWVHDPTCSEVIYWGRRGSGFYCRGERFRIATTELELWLCLARCLGIAALAQHDQIMPSVDGSAGVPVRPPYALVPTVAVRYVRSRSGLEPYRDPSRSFQPARTSKQFRWNRIARGRRREKNPFHPDAGLQFAHDAPITLPQSSWSTLAQPGRYSALSVHRFFVEIWWRLILMLSATTEFIVRTTGWNRIDFAIVFILALVGIAAVITLPSMAAR